MKKKQKKVNIKRLTIKQVDDLSKQIGEAIAEVMDEANERCNDILRTYGLQTKISYDIVKIEEDS